MKTSIMTHHIFAEKQKIRQIWFWVLLIGLDCLVFGLMTHQLLFEPETSPQDLIFPGILVLSINALFYTLHLSTHVDQSSLSFTYFPFLIKRKYHFSELESIELIDFSSLGGWGIKWNGDCWSYTTGGIHALLIKTKNKKFILGTQNPEDAKKAVDLFNSFRTKFHGC